MYERRSGQERRRDRNNGQMYWPRRALVLPWVGVCTAIVAVELRHPRMYVSVCMYRYVCMYDLYVCVYDYVCSDMYTSVRLVFVTPYPSEEVHMILECA